MKSPASKDRKLGELIRLGDNDSWTNGDGKKIMKTPERSRTSCIGLFLVLLPRNSLCDIMSRHNVTSRRHTVTSNIVTS